MFTRTSSSSVRQLRLWLVCVFGVYNLILSIQCRAGDGLCSLGTYANSTEPPVECLPCQTCRQGQGIDTACGGTNDTVCEDCTEEHYSKLTPAGRQCLECESCGPGRSEMSPCTLTQNTICGRCASGFFLYIDDRGSECKRCSRCPTDHIVVHWIECAEAGRPLNEQCAPGEWSESSPIYSATPLPSSPVAQAASTGRTRLPLSHGTFVPMTSYEQRGSRPPSQDSSTRTIAIISITFTVATFCVFMFASFVCAYKGICMLCKRCTCVRCRSEAGASSTTTRSSLIAPESDDTMDMVHRD